MTPRGTRFPEKLRLLSAFLILAALLGWLLFKGARPPASVGTTQTIASPPGSWQSVLLSPAGKRLAFVSDGGESGAVDLYVRPLVGGLPLRLTRDAAREGSPAWSPGGGQLAYLSRQGHRWEIRLVAADGGPSRVVTDGRETVGRGLTFSRDGRFLTFSRRPQEGQPLRLVRVPITITTEGGPLQTITNPPSGTLGDQCAVTSPDGTQLAFLRSSVPGVDDIYLTPVTGGRVRRLTVAQRPINGLTWAPDGLSLVFASDEHGRFELRRVGLDGSAPRVLSFAGQDVVEPSSSPAGQRLLFHRRPAETSVWRLSLVSPSHRPRRLIGSGYRDSAPRYSPDGQRIVFSSDRSGRPEIWVCRADGTRPVRLTHLERGSAGFPMWSPDGRLVAFEARVQGRFNVSVVPIDGGMPWRVTSWSGEERVPSWSLDGRHLFLASNRDGQWQVWRSPLRGGEPQLLTSHGGYRAREQREGVLVLSRQGEPGMWLREAGRITRLIEPGHRPSHRGWDVQGSNLYYLSSTLLQRLDLRTFRRHRVARLPANADFSTLAVSPDGRHTLFVRKTQGQGALFTTESFR